MVLADVAEDIAFILAVPCPLQAVVVEDLVPIVERLGEGVIVRLVACVVIADKHLAARVGHCEPLNKRSYMWRSHHRLQIRWPGRRRTIVQRTPYLRSRWSPDGRTLRRARVTRDARDGSW